MVLPAVSNCVKSTQHGQQVLLNRGWQLTVTSQAMHNRLCVLRVRERGILPGIRKHLYHRPAAAAVSWLQRQLAVAAGGDGTLRLLDVLRPDPLLLLEPAAGGLLATAWSPTRPLVFAAASG